MNAEYRGNAGCPQRDSAEHKGYVGAQNVGSQEVKEQDGADLLERILARENLNRAYKRVKSNKGAPGIDGMSVEDTLPWLREHREELLESVRSGKYKPQPVRRKEIPKPDGGVRKLGIPTVVDRIIQQAIAQQLVPIYEPQFTDNSFGYRPGRSGQQAIQRVKEYAEKGYTQNLIKLGMEPWKAYRNGNSSKGYWAVAGSGILNSTITNERLARAGYYSLSDRYESLHLCD